jgi:V/A-type H+-transporting ATPase subunit E
MASRNAHPTAAGVEALLERLEAEGVKAGEAKAAAIVAEAEAKARAIRAKAEAEASQMIEAARRDAANLERGGREALKVAMRDAVLDLKQALADRFRGEISRLVTRHTLDQDLLREMVLAVAGRAAETAAVDRAGRVTVVLPADAIGLDDLRRDPTELRDGRLGQFVLGSAGELLRQGVTLARSDDLAAGIEVRFEDHDIVLDLSDKAVAAVILEHLQPRFRALLEGVIG